MDLLKEYDRREKKKSGKQRTVEPEVYQLPS